MRVIVAWSLRYRLLVLGIAAGIMLFGYTQLSRASFDTLPEFGPPYVEIQTEALGLSAEEVEQLITVPLEADLLHGVAFLDEIHSQSVEGLSSIVLYFEPGTDVLRARQMVAERLTQAHALPNVSKAPAMLQPLSSSSRVMVVGLSSKDVSLIDMSVLAHWTIRPRLLSVPGVANVSVWGQRERQLQVQVDPDRMRQNAISLDNVIETAGNALWVSPLTFLDASTPGTGGFIDTANQRLGIQHISPIRSADDLAGVALVQDRTRPVQGLKLGDVATIVQDHQPLIGDAVVEDGPGLVLVIEKFPDANTVAVSRDVEAALAALQPGLTGIQVDTSLFRPADYVESSMTNVAIALLVALALIVLVIGLVLRHWRAALVALVTIPLSMAAGGVILILAGATINAIVVAGLVLAIGLLVDDAVVAFGAVEERARQRRPEDRDRTASAIILEATVEARGPLTVATLIVACAIVPLLLAGGVIGAFAPSMALAFGVAVLVSMLVALTVAPALCLLLRTDPGQMQMGSAFGRRLRQAYAGLLARILDRTRPAMLVLAVAAIGVVVLFGTSLVPQIARSPLPDFRDTGLLVHWDAAPGTSGQEMDRIVSKVSSELRAVPGVRDVGGHVGRAVLSDQVVDVDSGELWLSLDPNADYDATVAAVRGAVRGYPGFHSEVRTYASERVDALLPPSASDLTVRVYGQDIDLLQQQATAVREAVSGVPAVGTAEVVGQTNEPTIKIQVDLAAADRAGLKPGDIRRAAATLLSGIVVGSLFEDDKVFEVVVWSAPALRADVNAIRDLPIDTPTHDRQVRLGDVANITIGPSPTVIRREGVFRYVDVAVDVRGDDLTGAARAIDAAAKTVPMPLEYRAEVLHDYAERAATQTRWMTAAVAAALAIFLLLQAAFQSWRLAVLIFITLPAAILGGALAAQALGGMSIGTIFGFVTVLGITARSGILLVREFQRLETAGELTGQALILHAASERLVPFLATTLATIAAFAPFVILGDRPGYEVIRPMAVVLLGGLVTAMLLILFIVPTLYRRVASSPQGDAAGVMVPDAPSLEPSTA
jgi:Cu/Ag efflux pump CusA